MAATDIFDRLIQDHDKHRKLIKAIEATSGDSEERRSLYDEFRTDAKAHASAEEVTLYAILMACVPLLASNSQWVSRSRQPTRPEPLACRRWP